MMTGAKVSETCVWGWCHKWWRAEPGSSLKMCSSFHCNIGWMQIELVIPEEQFITLVGHLIENQDGESITACGITPPSSIRLVCACMSLCTVLRRRVRLNAHATRVNVNYSGGHISFWRERESKRENKRGTDCTLHG